MGIFLMISRLTRAAPRYRDISPRMMTFTNPPAEWIFLATTNPSPPLLPMPASTTKDLPEMQTFLLSASKAARPAFSMSRVSGMP